MALSVHDDGLGTRVRSELDARCLHACVATAAAGRPHCSVPTSTSEAAGQRRPFVLRADRPLGHFDQHRLDIERNAGLDLGIAQLGRDLARHDFLSAPKVSMMACACGLISILPSGRGVPTELKLPIVTMLA